MTHGSERREASRRAGTRLAAATRAAALLALVSQSPARATADEPDHAGPPPRGGEPIPGPDAAPLASRGAQVLPLPPPDASTAAGQERGNTALRSNAAPTESSAKDQAEGEPPRKQ
jgi:hypothetical protein